MTSAEKAVATRKRHKEARNAELQEKKILQKKMTDACLAVLDDPEASADNRMKAVVILHDLSKGW